MSRGIVRGAAADVPMHRRGRCPVTARRRRRLAVVLVPALAAAGLVVTRSGDAAAHTCVQVESLFPTSTTVVGACQPHDLTTHFCGVTPVTQTAPVVVVTECTDLVMA